MNELTTIRRKIADLFDQGNSEALDRLYKVLNKLMADLCIMRALLRPTQEAPEEPEEVLEVVESEPAAMKIDFSEK